MDPRPISPRHPLSERPPARDVFRVTARGRLAEATVTGGDDRLRLTSFTQPG